METKKLADYLPKQNKENFLKQLPAELQGQNLNEITLYNDNQAEPEAVATELAKLKSAFPAMDPAFISVLSERVEANAMTEKRLKDAIGYVIDTFKYQKPNISDIIGFDRRIKLYSYNDVCMLVNKGDGSFLDFEKHWIGETLYRIKKTDCQMYQFTPNSQHP